MKVVIQRVLEAKVVVEEQCIGIIGKGFLVLLGVGMEDSREIVDRYIDKILKLRIFADENGKTNLSLQEVQGKVEAGKFGADRKVSLVNDGPFTIILDEDLI